MRTGVSAKPTAASPVVSVTVTEARRAEPGRVEATRSAVCREDHSSMRANAGGAENCLRHDIVWGVAMGSRQYNKVPSGERRQRIKMDEF